MHEDFALFMLAAWLGDKDLPMFKGVAQMLAFSFARKGREVKFSLTLTKTDD